MIGEEAFKGFCRQAENGAHIRALFITPNSPARQQQQLDMLNMAVARGLNALFLRASNRLVLDQSEALLRIAHPYLDRELKGLHFNFVHGLEYLDAFEDGERIADELRARVAVL